MPNEDFAIVIGIDRYPKFRNLAGAVRDAEKFISWLLDANGGDLHPSNIARLMVENENQMTSQSLTDLVQEILEQRFFTAGSLNPGMLRRRLYFFFSGHGLGVDGREVALLGPGVRAANLGDNLGIERLRKFLQERALFEELVFVADCCRNVDAGLPVTLNNLTLSVKPADAALAGTVQSFVVYATRHGSVAFEEEDQTRGVLSTALMEGLRSNVAVDPQGRVTTDSIRPYLGFRVPKLAEFRQKKQQPDLQTLPFPAYVLRSAVRPTTPISVTLHVDAPGGGECVVTDPIEQRELRRLSLAATLTLTLPDRGPYRIRRTDTGQMVEIDLTDEEGPDHAVHL
jgi:hypothetical protein